MREPATIHDLIAQMSVISEARTQKLDARVHGGSDPSRPPSENGESLADEWRREWNQARNASQRADVLCRAREALIVARKAPKRSLTPNTLEWRVAIATAEGTVEEVSITFGCSRAHVYKLRAQLQSQSDAPV